jgi:hypothetical protein
LIFFSGTFLGVSRQGEFKNTIKIFFQKSMSKTNQKFRQKFRCQIFLDFFLFYRVFGYFFAMGVQKHYKKRVTKKIVSKSFYKKIDQKPKTDFLSKFVYHVLGRFLMSDEGSSKTRVKKYRKKKKINSTLVLFRTLTHPPTTHHGGHREKNCRPLGPDGGAAGKCLPTPAAQGAGAAAQAVGNCGGRFCGRRA